MPKYEMRHQQDDEDTDPREIVGSKDLRESFKDDDRIRGSWFLNGVELHQFEANSPANVCETINRLSERTGVDAQIDDQGHLVLTGQPGMDIRVRSGRPYEEAAPASTGDAAKDVLNALKTEGEKMNRGKDGNKNTVLEALGLDETEQQEEGDKNAAPRPGFETGASAEDRKKAREEREENAKKGFGSQPGSTAGQGRTDHATQVPSAPTTGGEQQGRLDDGRGRTGDGTGYSPRPDGGAAVPGTPANQQPQGVDPVANQAPKQSPPL